MSESHPERMKWWDRIIHEIGEYALIVIYLALVFAAFIQYRRLILAAHDITYTNYGIAVIEALILGKLIMVGGLFRLGRGLEEKPLIFPAVYKTVLFSLLVAVFTVVEHAIKGLWMGNGLAAGVMSFLDKGFHELLAGSLIIFVALLPFFAIRELGRVIGTDKMWALFFRGSTGQNVEGERE